MGHSNKPFSQISSMNNQRNIEGYQNKDLHNKNGINNAIYYSHYNQPVPPAPISNFNSFGPPGSALGSSSGPSNKGIINNAELTFAYNGYYAEKPKNFGTQPVSIAQNIHPNFNTTRPATGQNYLINNNNNNLFQSSPQFNPQTHQQPPQSQPQPQLQSQQQQLQKLSQQNPSHFQQPQSAPVQQQQQQHPLNISPQQSQILPPPPPPPPQIV